MSGPVDVLAVMDRDAELALSWNGRAKPESQQAFGESQEARAAVAELIAADTEYDRARAAWLADNSNHGEFLATRAAWDRRAAALARVRGAA